MFLFVIQRLDNVQACRIHNNTHKCGLIRLKKIHWNRSEQQRTRTSIPYYMIWLLLNAWNSWYGWHKQKRINKTTFCDSPNDSIFAKTTTWKAQQNTHDVWLSLGYVMYVEVVLSFSFNLFWFIRNVQIDEYFIQNWIYSKLNDDKRIFNVQHMSRRILYQQAYVFFFFKNLSTFASACKYNGISFIRRQIYIFSLINDFFPK